MAAHINATTIKLIHNAVLVSQIEKGMQQVGSVIIPDDDMKDRGIKPRWCKVFKVGPDVDDLEAGDWVLVEHGRWTRGIPATIEGEEHVFRWIDYNDVLGHQKESPPVETQ